MLNKELKQKIHDYIRMNYNGKNSAEVMYNLHLEIEDIFWEVKQEIQEENGN